MSKSYVFLDRRTPRLAAGGYTVTTRLDVEVDGRAVPATTAAADFWVGGERFALGPGPIHSCYPPQGSSGAYDLCLPHLALRRDTLPWERSGERGGGGTPWLALLVLHQDEAMRTPLESMSLAEYRGLYPGVAGPEPDQHDSDRLAVITLDGALATALIPGAIEAMALCHVRGTEVDGALTESVAVVVSKRVPGVGRNTVHLVSLEDRYVDGRFEVGTRCVLVSLASWSFSCEAPRAVAPGSLAVLFGELDGQWLRVPPPARDATLVEPYLSRARTALPHRFRSGESGVSWYSGPLVPASASDERALVPLPAGSADALAWYDDRLGMLDVSYAAAWELGRLLALEDRAMATALADWRRRQVIRARREVERARQPHLPQLERAREVATTAPTALSSWLATPRLLATIPFKYLVPDERMLPVESLRFFVLNRAWLDALRDGALSLARARSARADEASEVRSPAETTLLAALPAEPACGFLVRSAIVSGWPDLDVEGVTRGDIASLHPGRTVAPLPPISLSPSIALYLFPEVIATVRMRQHPSTVHLALRGEAGPFVDTRSSAESAQLAARLIDSPQTLEVSVVG